MSDSSRQPIIVVGAVVLAVATMFAVAQRRHPKAAHAADPVASVARLGANASGAPTPNGDPVGDATGMPPGYRGTQAQNFIRMRMRELALAEEQRYNETNAYSSDVASLPLLKRTGDVVTLRVTYAGPAGWSAEATHPALPGKSCVMYVGPTSVLPAVPQTMAEHVQPLGERDLVCDKT